MNPMVETETDVVTAAFQPPPAAPFISSAEIPTRGGVARRFETERDDSLFDRFAWLYVFFRERLFRDDTQRIIHALWPAGRPKAGARVLEVGCGPGFYSCELAGRFPTTRVIGVDRSTRQLQWARKKARRRGLSNCRFETDDVL